MGCFVTVRSSGATTSYRSGPPPPAYHAPPPHYAPPPRYGPAPGYGPAPHRPHGHYIWFFKKKSKFIIGNNNAIALNNKNLILILLKVNNFKIKTFNL